MGAPHALSLPGELTIQHAADLKLHLSASLAALQDLPAPPSLVLDLSEVSELDSAGVQLLLSLRHSLRQRGMSLHLAPASRVVQEVVKTLGLDTDGLLDGAPGAATGVSA